MAADVLIVGCDDGPLAALKGLLGEGCATLSVDLLDREAVQAACAGVKTVVVAVPLAGDEDALLRATAGLYNIVKTPELQRLVLLSTLSHFERYPPEWQVTELWSPRPTLSLDDLVPLLSESLLREAAHERPLLAVCLRLGRVVAGVGVRDRRAVHIEDVAQAVWLAMRFAPELSEPATGWRVFHIVGAGDTRFPLGLAGRPSHFPNGGRGTSLGYSPQHDLASGASYDHLKPAPSPPPTKPYAGRPGRVALFGAAGPFGAVASDALSGSCVLRMVDRRSYEEALRDLRPQQPGAPLPRPLYPPHESVQADVTDLEQVTQALKGVDCAVNLAVVRDDAVQAFRVNTLGTYNVLRAALDLGIRRVVLTGPSQLFDPMNGGHSTDFWVGDDLPQRPGSHMYMLSKYLGQELARVFAAEAGMEVPALVWGYFFEPREQGADPLGGHPFTVSWEDTGEAIARAVLVESFAPGFAVIPVQGDTPHGKFPNARARALLGWEPRPDLSKLWLRTDSGWV